MATQTANAASRPIDFMRVSSSVVGVRWSDAAPAATPTATPTITSQAKASPQRWYGERACEARTVAFRTWHGTEAALDQGAPVRVDHGRQSGRGGAHQVAPILDGAQRRDVELLARRRGVPEPRVVREVDQDVGALVHRLADASGNMASMHSRVPQAQAAAGRTDAPEPGV